MADLNNKQSLLIWLSTLVAIFVIGFLGRALIVNPIS
jgi:hypothetical protein